MSFIIEELRSPRTIGAFLPSSHALARKMVATIDFSQAQVIVEYGPGTGIFTQEIVARKRNETLFLIIEQNEVFYQQLVQLYAHKDNVILIHGDAKDLNVFLNQHGIAKIDYIVSGLPFTSLPLDLTHEILRTTRDHLSPQGSFITFQYTLFKRIIFERFFTIQAIHREYLNFPPAYVLIMKGHD